MRYDLAIVGGGMVGGALAVALQESHLRIALIDAAAIDSRDDPRLIALNYSSYSLLKKLNIWPALSSRAEAIHEVHVSMRGQFGSTRLTAEEFNLPALGYVVPAKYINAALSEKLKNIDYFRPEKVNALSQDNEGVRLVTDMRTLEAKKVIAADGTHSSIRALLNIPADTVDYQQKALVTITELQREHKNIAYERFQKTGAIAMLPLTENRAATIWSGENELIEKLMQLSDAEFLSTLQKEFGYRLGRLKKNHQRHIFPLTRVVIKEQIHDHIIFIGNAAHTIHPIAAQGLNIALAEVAALTDHFTSHPSPFEKGGLRGILQKNHSLNLSHHLTQLFSADFLPLNLARQLGLISLDLCPPLKKYFAARTAS